MIVQHFARWLRERQEAREAWEAAMADLIARNVRHALLADLLQHPAVTSAPAWDRRPRAIRGAVLCPACGVDPVSPGVLAPFGPAGVQVEVCVSCSTVSRATEAELQRQPLRHVGGDE